MSLFPLGLISQGGGGGAGGGTAFELISTQVLASTTSSVTFSSIPSTYKHLQIRSVVKSVAADNILDLRMNSDTGTSYSWHRLYGWGSIASGGTSSTNRIRVNMAVSESGTSNAFSPMIMDILDYGNTNKYKTVRAFSGQTDWNVEVDFTSGLWLNTSAVTSLTLFTASYNMAVGSRFSLYGVS